MFMIPYMCQEIPHHAYAW